MMNRNWGQRQDYNAMGGEVQKSFFLKLQISYHVTKFSISDQNLFFFLFCPVIYIYTYFK